MLDRHLSWIAESLRVDLGRWIARRYKLLQDKEKVAHRLLHVNGHTFEHLREQWDLQQDAQMSVRKSTHPADRIRLSQLTSAFLHHRDGRTC